MRVLAEASMPMAIEATMRRLFPRHCVQLGPHGCVQTVRDAIARGKSFGFENAQLPAYVSLEFSFGTDFSTNAEYAWAQELLHDRQAASAPRMQSLRTKAIFYLARLAEDA